MAVNPLEPRDMLSMLEKIFAPKSGFREAVVRGRHNTHAVKNLDIKVRKRKRVRAPHVKRTSKGVKIDLPATRLDTIEPPYIRMHGEIDPESLNEVAPQQVVYSPNHDPEDNLMRLIAEQLDIMRNAGLRNVDVQISQALSTGTIQIRGKDDDNEEVRFDIDFERDPQLTGTLTGGDLWDSANSKPEQTIRSISRLLGEKSDLTPTDMFAGSVALDALLCNESMERRLDVRRLEAGRINADQVAGDGLAFYGTVSGVRIWGFDDWYYDENTSQNVPLIPEDRILLFSDMADYSVEYGMISDIRAGNYAVEWFPKNWIEEAPSSMHVMLQGAPVFLPKDIDSTASWKVV